MDVAAYIGEQVKTLMRLLSSVDQYMPDEADVEVLMAAFDSWSSTEVTLLFPALEKYTDESDAVLSAANKRIGTLRNLEDTMHLGEGADAPYSELAGKYMAAVKYHLLVDVQDIMPLALQLPDEADEAIVRMMRKQAEAAE